MELSSFSENIVVKTLKRGSQSVELHVNIDAIVPDYYRILDERLAPLTERVLALQTEIAAMLIVDDDKKAKQKGDRKSRTDKQPSRTILAIERDIAEVQREAWAERLTLPVRLPDGTYTSLLKDWDVTDQGRPLPVSKDVLLKMPPAAVQAIGEFCLRQIETVKKNLAEEEMSEATPGGSPALRVVGQST